MDKLNQTEKKLGLTPSEEQLSLFPEFDMVDLLQRLVETELNKRVKNPFLRSIIQLIVMSILPQLGKELYAFVEKREKKYSLPLDELEKAARYHP